MYRYTVEDEFPFAVNIYNIEVNNEMPFIYQPHEPSGRNWESKEEAEAWANLWILDIEYAEANPPSEEEILVQKLASIGISVDQLKSVLGLS